jgi:hypothetical protein
MAYVIERESRAGRRYVGIYRAADGKYKSAGTYDAHERAYEVAEEEERHARGFLGETGPADKAKMTIAEFCGQRFLRYHAVSPSTRQEYGYAVKNQRRPVHRSPADQRGQPGDLLQPASQGSPSRGSLPGHHPRDAEGPVGLVPDGVRRGLPEQQPHPEHPDPAGTG